MTEPRALARHLAQCAVVDRDPITAVADAKLWFLALSQLVAINALDAAAFAAPRLVRAFPAVASFQRTALLLKTMPPMVDDPAFAYFADRGDRDVQIVRRAGALTVLFAFTGRYGGLGMPLPILHRWFGQAHAHVVYLRDLTDKAYNEGIDSLASDRQGTIDALRAIAEELGTTRAVFYANSSGGYGALLYALELPAAAVLAFGAVTELSPAFLQARVGDRTSIAALPSLRPLYDAALVKPKVRLVYGAANQEDAASARKLEGVPGVNLNPVVSCSGHDSQMTVVADGRMGALLSELVGPAAIASVTATPGRSLT